MKKKPRRMPLPQFWGLLEDELDELLGGSATSGARRDFGTYEHYDVDTEGAYWCSLLPGELDERPKED